MTARVIMILFFFFANNYTLAAQENSLLQYKIGVGTSLSGAGDVIFYEINNGLNLKLNSYIDGDFNLTYGAPIANRFVPSASLVKTDINILFSPFKNTKKLGFRIGGGASYYYSPRVFEKSSRTENGVLVDIQYENETISAFGLNTIIEFLVNLNDQSKISLQGHISFYQESIDINSGFSINYYRRFQL